MKQYLPGLALGMILLGGSCDNNRQVTPGDTAQQAPADSVQFAAKDSIAKVAAPGKTVHAETLHFVAFNGDGDYYLAYFINAAGEIQSFYCNDVMADSLASKVMRIQWQMDTFYAAGDGETPYEGESLLSYEILPQKPFMAYKAPNEIEADISALPAVAALNENSASISRWPKSAQDCYEVSVYAREPEPGSDVPYGKLKYIYKVYQVPAYRIAGPEIPKEDTGH